MTIPTARERYARIIDPNIWASTDRMIEVLGDDVDWRVVDSVRSPSLAKADLILSGQAGESGEGTMYAALVSLYKDMPPSDFKARLAKIIPSRAPTSKQPKIDVAEFVAGLAASSPTGFSEEEAPTPWDPEALG